MTFLINIIYSVINKILGRSDAYVVNHKSVDATPVVQDKGTQTILQSLNQDHIMNKDYLESIKNFYLNTRFVSEIGVETDILPFEEVQTVINSKDIQTNIMDLDGEVNYPSILPTAPVQDVGVQTKSLYEAFVDEIREISLANTEHSKVLDSFNKVDEWQGNLETASNQINIEDDVLHLSDIKYNITDIENFDKLLQQDKLLRETFGNGKRNSYDQFNDYFDDFISESSTDINIGSIAEIISSHTNY